MLRLMLLSPNISIPPEGPFATQLMGKYGDDRDWSPDRTEQFARRVLNSGDPKIDYWKLDLDSLMFRLTANPIADYGTAVATVYETYLAKNKPSANRWGDKSGTVGSPN